MALDRLSQGDASEQAKLLLFIISHSRMRSRRNANQKQESMSTLPHPDHGLASLAIRLTFIACEPNGRSFRRLPDYWASKRAFEYFDEHSC